MRYLVSLGMDTDRKILKLTTDEIIMFENIKTEDIRLIRKLQQDMKNRNGIGFLTKADDEEEEEKEQNGGDADDDGAGSGDDEDGPGSRDADYPDGQHYRTDGIYQ